jgi:predicted porin
MVIERKWWIAGAVAAALLAGWVYSAKAGDLGGSCCADLEERVSELEATAARKGNRKMSLTVSGQVSKALLWHDIDGLNGADSFRAIDNANSGTRLNFAGSGKINPNLSVGFVVEIGVDESKGKLLYDIFAADDIALRHSYAWVETSFGKVSLGHTSSATDGIVEISVANTTVASLPLSIEPLWTYLGAPTAGGISLNPAGFDGGRSSVIRYDTPTMGGFQGSVAFGGGQSASYDDVWDAALRYAGEFGGVRVAAGVGYRVDSLANISGPETKTMAGSASAMHMLSGIFATVSAAKQDDHVLFGDLQMWQVQAGVEKKLTEMGATTLFMEYAEHKLLDADVKSTFWGVGAVQAIDAASTDLFISFRQYDLGGAMDASVGMGGIRVKF